MLHHLAAPSRCRLRGGLGPPRDDGLAELAESAVLLHPQLLRGLVSGPVPAAALDLGHQGAEGPVLPAADRESVSATLGASQGRVDALGADWADDQVVPGLEDLSVARYPSIAGHPRVAGYPRVAEHLRVAGYLSIAGHPRVAGWQVRAGDVAAQVALADATVRDVLGGADLVERHAPVGDGRVGELELGRLGGVGHAVVSS